MVFSSTIFIFCFLPSTLAGYYLIKKDYRNYWLLFMSIVFFGWSQPRYLWIILINIILNYCAALLIDDLKTLRKPVLIVSIISNLVILFYFKYFNFAINSVNRIIHSNFAIKDIILPIG